MGGWWVGVGGGTWMGVQWGGVSRWWRHWCCDEGVLILVWTMTFSHPSPLASEWWALCLALWVKQLHWQSGENHSPIYLFFKWCYRHTCIKEIAAGGWKVLCWLMRQKFQQCQGFIKFGSAVLLQLPFAYVRVFPLMKRIFCQLRCSRGHSWEERNVKKKMIFLVKDWWIYNTTLLPSVNTVALRMFWGAKSTHHTFTPH